MLKSIVLIVFVTCVSITTQAQFNFQKVTDSEQFHGVWQVLSKKEMPLIADEDAPTGYILVFGDDMNYLSGYIDPEMGASIDLQFSYEFSEGLFDCVMIGSNSLGYYMQNENRPFKFKLEFTPDGKYLKLVNEEKRVYVLERPENMDAIQSED